jgi:hypothetical protein
MIEDFDISQQSSDPHQEAHGLELIQTGFLGKAAVQYQGTQPFFPRASRTRSAHAIIVH